MTRTKGLSVALGMCGLVAAGTILESAAHAQGPYQYHAITPCRIIDTRHNPGDTGQTNGVSLTAPGPHQFRIQGFCGVPNGARAVTLNASVIGPNRNGDLRMFPVGVGVPVVATMSFNANEPALSNGAIVPLATVASPTDRDLEIRHAMPPGDGGGRMHLTIDVTGYFM